MNSIKSVEIWWNCRMVGRLALTRERRRIFSRKYWSMIFLLAIFMFMTSCSIGNKRKEIQELTESDIESILSICHEDTIMVLGRFIEFYPDNVVHQSVGHYYFVASLLGRPFESGSDIDSMRNIVHKLYIKTRGSKKSMIAIPSTFVPEIRITDKLNQTSLRDLILSDITINNIEDVYQGENSFILEWSTSLYKKKDRSKYVSDQSNLAKVFFIQEKNTFIELNKFYYFKIRHDFMDKQLKQQEQLEERSAQSKWNDYLQ